MTESAAVVVGADGRHSRLAHVVGAPEYESVPPVACWYFSYWSGVPDRNVGIYVRRDEAIFVFPTNDSLLGVFVGWPIDRLAAVMRTNSLSKNARPPSRRRTPPPAVN